MRILVIGGTRFLGPPLVRRLLVRRLPMVHGPKDYTLIDMLSM
jgi:hypothetical protein